MQDAMPQQSDTYYNHLGYFSPYYIKTSVGKFITDQRILGISKNLGANPEIDVVAISEVLNNRFMLGDRTILKDVKRTPWLARWADENSAWKYHDLKTPENKIRNEEAIADDFFELICDEIVDYVNKYQRIGMLLSGGMDSRIVAGTLDHLVKTKRINPSTITAYTWGNHESRDVVYAKIIAKRLQWEWKHYVVTAKDLWENFKIAGTRGAEYSGIHLHAIPQIAADADVDVMLAGSYGDSIGRAEYSGRKVIDLKPIDNCFRNFKSMLQSKKFDQIKDHWKDDVSKYHELFPRKELYEQYELDYQLHYMRRMLNSCMEVLNDKVPTFQVFTSPKVYEYTWSLDHSCRTDLIYKHLMKKFETGLSDIPWARTGVPYLEKGEPDAYEKKHHSYARYIQYDLFDEIRERALSDRIESLQIFNMNTIKTLIKLIKFRRKNNFDYLERMTWLVSLDFFLEEINSSADAAIKGNRSMKDAFSANIVEPIRYMTLTYLR